MFARKIGFMMLLTCAVISLKITAQKPLPKPQKTYSAWSIEGLANWNLQSGNIKRQDYAPIYGKNSFTHEFTAKYNKYFHRNGWGVYICFGQGAKQEEFYMNIDLAKISTDYYGIAKIPIHNLATLTPNTIDTRFRSQYVSMGLGASKRWDIKKWFINADIGFLMRKYIQRSRSQSGFNAFASVDSNLQSFTYLTYGLNYSDDFTGLLYDAQIKVGYSFYNKHHIFASLGGRHFILFNEGVSGHHFTFYNYQNQKIGYAEQENFYRQLNFGLGYQLSF